MSTPLDPLDKVQAAQALIDAADEWPDPYDDLGNVVSPRLVFETFERELADRGYEIVRKR